jgi:hypothetical protein
MKPMQCFPHLEHLVLLACNNEARRLLDIDLLLQVIIQEHQFDIHVVHLPPLMCRKSDE